MTQTKLDSTITESYMASIENGQKVYEKLLEMTKDPMKYNADLLMKILEDNKDTEYGKKYDFESIKTIKDYQNKVPITTYDDYADYIYRMTEKEEKNLITNYEVDHYAKSSGTMGNPKRIPTSLLNQKISKSYLNDMKHYLLTQKNGYDWINHSFLNLVEVSISTLKNGATYGSVSGKLLGTGKKSLVTTPIEGLMPNVETDTRYIHARFALIHKDIQHGITSFVSLFLESLRYIKENWELLVNDIEKGTIDESVKMTDDVRKSLSEKIEPMPARAEELRKIFSEDINAFVPKVWPEFKLLAGVGTGGFANYLKKIKEFTGRDFNFFLYGLNASEGTFTTPLELNNPDAVLIPDSMFYEFLPMEAKGDFTKVVTLDKLEIGKDYEVITTNLSGFYRYRMKDVIRCIGKENEMPVIEYLYRLDQCLSLTGEKVNEENLRAAAYSTEKEIGFDLIDFSAYADSDASPMKYIFLMEVADFPEDVTKEMLEEKLNKNFCATDPVLAYKIEKGLLGKTEMRFLQPETYLFYKELRVARGTSSAQVKPPRILRDEPDMKFFMVLLDDELN